MIYDAGLARELKSSALKRTSIAAARRCRPSTGAAAPRSGSGIRLARLFLAIPVAPRNQPARDACVRRASSASSMRPASSICLLKGGASATSRDPEGVGARGQLAPMSRRPRQEPFPSRPVAASRAGPGPPSATPPVGSVQVSVPAVLAVLPAPCPSSARSSAPPSGRPSRSQMAQARYAHPGLPSRVHACLLLPALVQRKGTGYGSPTRPASVARSAPIPAHPWSGEAPWGRKRPTKLLFGDEGRGVGRGRRAEPRVRGEAARERVSGGQEKEGRRAVSRPRVRGIRGFVEASFPR